MYPFRRGDTDFPRRENWNDSDELRAAVADALRYKPAGDDAWHAHSVTCYVRDHHNINGVGPESFDGWDVEKIAASFVEQGVAEYASTPPPPPLPPPPPRPRPEPAAADGDAVEITAEDVGPAAAALNPTSAEDDPHGDL